MPEPKVDDPYLNNVGRIEPNLVNGGLDKGPVLVSIAISLKRIADSLELVTSYDRAAIRTMDIDQ